jgi:hypothetical protein
MTFFELVTGFVYIERSLYLINHREVEFVKGSGDFFWLIAQPAPTGAAPRERIARPEMRQNVHQLTVDPSTPLRATQLTVDS